MIDIGVTAEEHEGDLVAFLPAGSDAKGEFHCSGCGYGVIVHTQLPSCPMCGGETWERSAWSPLTRARRYAL